MRRSMISGIDPFLIAALMASRSSLPTEKPEPPTEEMLAQIKAESERREAAEQQEREDRAKREHPVERVSATRDFLEAQKKRRRR